MFENEDYIIPDSPIIKDYTLPKRPEFGKRGTPARINVNAYPVIRFPTSAIHQYDCSLGIDGSKRALIRKLWNSPQLQEKLGRARSTVIFDGSKLAWSIVPLSFGEQLTMMINLDEGNSRPPRAGAPTRDNSHRVVIRKTGTVPLQVVSAYLEGKCDHDNSVIAGINFLDHLIRETPAKNFVAIKRSFFQRDGFKRLEQGVEAWKGIFQSLRMAQGGRLIMNVDAATACFWASGNLVELAMSLCRFQTPQDLLSRLDREGPRGKLRRDLRRLKKVQFFCKHRSRDKEGTHLKAYTIEGFDEKSAKDTFFELRRRKDDGTEDVSKISIADYYYRTYNIRLKFPGLPLVQTRKRGELFPMELCFIVEGQRYPFKLGERQTSDMIKFTVQRPTDRMNTIKGNVAQLDWKKDPILREYGLEVDSNMFRTTARILPVPKIVYGPGSENQTFAPQGGRWDLRGKKFADWGAMSKNGMGLKSWGIMVFGSPRDIPETTVKAFVRVLIGVMVKHGGNVVFKDPPIMYADQGKNAGTNIFELYKKSGNKVNMKPQLLFFILTAKAAQPYNDIKAYTDLQLGIPSQCMQHRHVEQAKEQYCSNICLKVNAKMGGVNVNLAPADHPLYGQATTMVIGADVSHASPGNPTGSYASMVGSTNLQGTRFAAIANTNGTRSECISGKNIFNFVVTLLRSFNACTGKKPMRIIYFRDGVSEGEYEKIISTELEGVKQACASMSDGYNPKFTVVICSKRHHFRFFPADRNASDRNGNPLPGTIVEKDITHPTQFDFYLNSHNAIQGTARPVHYHVIWDENKFPPDAIQGLIYNTCYTYVRATCSVSLVPATYYAHIASSRARCHEEGSADDRSSEMTPPSNDPEAKARYEAKKAGKIPDLRTLHTDLRFKMWYV